MVVKLVDVMMMMIMVVVEVVVGVRVRWRKQRWLLHVHELCHRAII